MKRVGETMRNLQKVGKTMLAAGMVAAALLSATACDENGNGNSNGKVTTFPPITTRSPEEIAQTGLTAADVLAEFDKLADKYESYRRPYYDYPDDKSQWDGYSVRFTSITPELGVQRNQIDDFTYPFHIYHDLIDYEPGHLWFLLEKHPKYNPNVESMGDVYTTTFKYEYTIDGVYETFSSTFGVSGKSFESVLNAFNVQKVTVTEEKINEWVQAIEGLRRISLLKYRDQEVWERFDINREVIENANQEQLQALYEMINSMTTINIYGYFPEEDIRYAYDE